MNTEQMIAFYEALRKETRETLNNRYLNPANKARLSGEIAMCEIILDHLNMLAKNLLQAAVTPTLGGWISVKDRLPENNQDVIFYTPKYYFEVGIACYRDGVFVYGGARYRATDETSHWMPIPSVPPNAG